MDFKISVILPIYNVEKYIADCIESIVKQSYKNFEVILVNDGTPDSSINIAKKILDENKIFYKIIEQENQGVSVARNAGIKNANGEWIICVDPDDIIDKNFLKVLLNCCEEFNVNISFSGYKMFTSDDLYSRDKIKDNKLYSSSNLMKKFLTRKIKIISPGILMKKDLIAKEELWYPEDIHFSEDQYFIWRLLFNQDNFGYNSTSIYKYRRRKNSTMTSSRSDKILTGYLGFLELEKNLFNNKNFKYADLILPRWVLGTLRSSSKSNEIKDFQYLAHAMNYKKQARKLMKFPDVKTNVLSIILLMHLKLFYKLGRLNLSRR